MQRSAMAIDPKIINLRTARKDRERSEARAEAAANAALHGRTKAQRVLEATMNETAKRKLDQLKFEDE